jgi:hypothetical protein
VPHDLTAEAMSVVGSTKEAVVSKEGSCSPRASKVAAKPRSIMGTVSALAGMVLLMGALISR